MDVKFILDKSDLGLRLSFKLRKWDCYELRDLEAKGQT